MIISSAVAPSLAFLSYFYLRDRYEAEPLQLVGFLFLLGMLSTIPVITIDNLLRSFIQNPFAHTFFISTLLEEIAKFAFTYWFAVRHKECNEEYDGILYAVSCSLGFATIENILKVWHAGMEVAALRAVLAVPGHALFGVLMGSYLGKAKFAISKRIKLLYLALALLIPWVCHGSYDLLIMSDRLPILLLMIPFMVWLIWNSFTRIREAEEHSPFKSSDIHEG